MIGPIVIEGPDGTGKTTLARQFEKLGFRYIHNGVPKPGENLFKTYTDQLMSNRDKVVFDRLHIGELVYGTQIRGVSLVSIEQIRCINRLIHGLNGIIIYCDTSQEQILKNWGERHALEYVQEKEKIIRVCSHYREIVDHELQQHRRNYYLYDYKRHTGDFALSVLNVDRPRVPNGVIGSPIAKYVFVGEQSNGPHDIAFYGVTNCTGWLNKLLIDAGFREDELAFTNALLMTPSKVRRSLAQIYLTYRVQDLHVKFIALGKVAAKACQEQGVPFLEAPHPQHWKRFHSKQRDHYIKLLRSFR